MTNLVAVAQDPKEIATDASEPTSRFSANLTAFLMGK